MLTDRFSLHSTSLLKKRLRLKRVALYIVWASASFSIVAALTKGEQDLLIASFFVLLISIFAYQQKREIVRELANRAS